MEDEEVKLEEGERNEDEQIIIEEVKREEEELDGDVIEAAAAVDVN